MGFKLLMIFIVLHSVASIEVQNGTVSSYDPSELLLKIFNPNNTVLHYSPRQAGNGLRFEDDPQSGPSGPADEDQGQYGLTTFDDNTPLRFQDDPGPNVDGPIRPHPSGPTGEDQGQYGLIVFDDNTPLRFQDDGPPNPGPNLNRPINLQNSDPNVGKPVKFEDSDIENPSVNFQDDNKIENHNKRKRKRRRKPKRVHYQPGLGNPVVPGVPGVQGGSGVPGVYGNPGPYQGYGPGYGHPGLQGVRIKRPRRRRPQPSSLASDALTAVTGALTSIARYDDYQCVPRLLCEAAGGGALGSGGVLDSIAGLQPLLTLLSVYNGISSSPLFVFGRAVFLGMTSKGNTGTCRYAYAQCPTDPEQLIHYLNNHNGGFFRFFNAPPNQNLEQFYQHLGQNGLYQGQNYYLPDQNGLHQPNQNGPYQPGLNGPYQPGLNGHYQPGQNVYDPNQNYYQTGQNPGQNSPYPQIQIPNYGNSGIYPHKPSLYGNQNYGQNYAFDYNNYGGKLRFRDMEKIEKRIQNKPAQEYVEDFNDFLNDDDNIENLDDSNNDKWAFPESSENINEISIPQNENNIRDSNSLKFPEDGRNTDYNKILKNSVDSNRKGKFFFFSNNNRGNQNNGVKYVNNNDYNKIKNQQSSTNRPIISNNYNNQNNNNYKPTNNFNSNNYGPPNKINNNYTPANNFNNYKPPYNYNYYNNQNTNLNDNDYYYDHNHNFYVKKDNNPSNKVNDYNNYNNNNNYKPPNNFNNYNNQNNNFNNNDYYYDHKHNFYVKKDNNPSDKVNDYNNNNNYKRPNYYNNQNNNYYNNPSDKVYDGHNNGVNTVYVVRGNGDPNNPEIVKIRPGQSVY